MAAVRPLGWRDDALLDDLLVRAGVSTLEREAVRFAFQAGAVGAVLCGEAALLHQGRGGCFQLVGTLGAPDEAALQAAFRHLQAEARLLYWMADAERDWLPALAPLGARPFTRRTYVQDLARVAVPAAPTALTLGPWEAAPELLERLAAAREGSLDGVFLTSPQAPTREACLAAYQKALADPARPLLPWASFVAYLDGRPVGLLLCVQGNHERQGLLFDLFADPEARGQGVGRALVGAMQQALVARGYTENMFLAASDNGPVHRLFTPDQIVRQDETHGAWWCAHA